MAGPHVAQWQRGPCFISYCVRLGFGLSNWCVSNEGSFPHEFLSGKMTQKKPSKWLDYFMLLLLINNDKSQKRFCRKQCVQIDITLKNQMKSHNNYFFNCMDSFLFYTINFIMPQFIHTYLFKMIMILSLFFTHQLAMNHFRVGQIQIQIIFHFSYVAKWHFVLYVVFHGTLAERRSPYRLKSQLPHKQSYIILIKYVNRIFILDS